MTQSDLAALAELSRVTVNQLENGAAPDIGIKKMAKVMDVVGLALVAKPRRTPTERDFLAMACTSANVSLKKRITPDDLATVLLTGRITPDLRPHMRVILEELPRSVLEGAVRQVARTKDVTTIKQNLVKLADRVGCSVRVG